MKQFSHSVPKELLESAKIDGCGELRTFVSIVLPIIKPGIGALAIFTFISSWNDYFSQLIFTNSEIMKTLPLGVASMSQQAEFSLNYGLMMAGANFSITSYDISIFNVPKLLYSGSYYGGCKRIMEIILAWLYYSKIYILGSLAITHVLNKAFKKLYIAPLLINMVSVILLFLVDENARTYAMYFSYMPVVISSILLNITIYFLKK